MMEAATVYERKGELYLCSESKTTAGVWIVGPPFLKKPLESSAATLGEAVLHVLAGSTESVEHPTNWNGLLQPLLDLADVKSWAAFSRNAACVGVEREKHSLRLIPNRNLGVKDGFEAIPDQAIELPANASAEAVGAALKDVIARCVR